MTHITGRALRTAIGTAAAIAALALPLVLGTTHAPDPDGAPVVRAAQAAATGTEPDEPGEPGLPKPTQPGDDKGSWVWDKEKP
ncbi:hypothetical protein GCM10027074_08990 [Streptomyces deserti]